VSLLSADSVVDYLVARGLVDADWSLRVEPLGGGVSNVVLAVTGPGVRVVVKQALPELAVADHWRAKRERALTEAAAIEVCRRLMPGCAPRLLDVDPEACALVVELAPDGWHPWKDDLLAGRADPDVARWLGATLRAWHDGTRDEASRERFDDAEAFEQLRVDPYYRTVMRRLPDLAGLVGPFVERMEATRSCLVHGDYSPKNVLVSDGEAWVIDFEVAHTGDPAFDLAFMLNHLMLKAIHAPASRHGFVACAQAFWDAYGELDDPGYVLGHVGCLMVARVDGKSPAEYLTDAGREHARSSGTSLLRKGPDALDDAWALIG